MKLTTLSLSCATQLFLSQCHQTPTPVAGNKNPKDTLAKGPFVIKEYDLNGDGKTDIFEYIKEVVDKTHQGHIFKVVARRDTDLNRDGKIDVIRFYNDLGELTEEQFDLDFDGKMDVKNFYQNTELAKQEIDHNFDGKPDTIKFYEKGKLVRKEMDTKFKGKPNHFEFYVNGEIERIGVDSNGDGIIDRWESLETLAKEGGSKTPAPSTPVIETVKAPAQANPSDKNKASGETIDVSEHHIPPR